MLIYARKGVFQITPLRGTEKGVNITPFGVLILRLQRCISDYTFKGVLKGVVNCTAPEHPFWCKYTPGKLSVKVCQKEC